MREKEITSKQEQILYFHVVVSYKREHRNGLLQVVPTIGMREAYLIHSFTPDTVTVFLTPRTCTLSDLTRLPVDLSSIVKNFMEHSKPERTCIRLVCSLMIST